MNLLLNKAHFPVTALGPGRRIGLWFQGCSIHCPGCVSRDTWGSEAHHGTTTEAILTWCRSLAINDVDGVTISGGEPFEQPEALACVVEGIRAWGAASGHTFDILVYSGMPLRVLERRFHEILEHLDAIITEPFVERLAPGGIWRGSSNQQLVALSELGRTLYRTDALADRPWPFQFSIESGQIWYIGVPRPGHLKELEARARARGLEWTGASWRA